MAKKRVPGQRARAKLMTIQKKWTLTVIFTALVIAAGVFFQWRYDRRKEDTVRQITEYYRQKYQHEPDAISLKRWVTLAQNRYGVARVERNYIDKGKDEPQ